MRLALGLAQAAFLSACAGAPAVTVPASGKLVHVVAFWFKPDAPADLGARMTDLYTQRVAAVPGVENVWVGRAQPSDRDVVDDSFSLMSIVRFRDAQAEGGWQTHPVHDDLRRLMEPHLARVVVYDFVE